MALPMLVASDWGTDDLGQAITLLSAQVNAANHRLLKMIAEFDRRGGWREDGAMRSCAHWLAARCGMVMGAAREKVRVARCLAALPEVDGAFAGGELSYSKVRAVTRVATPENEGFLVTLAERHSASHLEKLVSKYEPVPEPGLAGLLESERPESAPESGAAAAEAPACNEEAPQDDEARREGSRELYWFQDEDGMWVVHARLPPEQGQLVAKVLQAVARPLEEARREAWQQQQKARMQAVARKILQRSQRTGAAVNGSGAVAPERAAGAATAAVIGEARDGARESQAGGVAAEASGFDPGLGEGVSAETPLAEAPRGQADAPPPDHLAYARAEEKISAETFSQHMNQIRADALVAMVEHFLAGGPDYRKLKGLGGAERCQVVLHVDVNTLREQRAGLCCPHQRAHFEHKPWLAPATARRLSCDASLVTVLEDENGKVLNVGRRSRVVPAQIRRALQERDGVCQYPGCHESEYVDAHHVRHWADGGETSLDNLVTLCRFHHRQLHRGRFDVTLERVAAETRVRIVPPAAQPPPAPEPTGAGGNAPG